MKVTLTVPTTTTTEVEINHEYYKNIDSTRFFRINQDGTVTYIKNYQNLKLEIHPCVEKQSINFFAEIYFKECEPCTSEDWMRGLESVMDLLNVV